MAGNRRIKVLLADDHLIVRMGLSALLGLEKDIEMVGEAANGEEAVRLTLAKKPDVVILDLMMPNGNGVVKLLVDGAGSEKILYGTDLPWFDEYSVIGGILGDGISDEDVRNILYRNAQKILGEKVSD